jgi:dihydroorotase
MDLTIEGKVFINNVFENCCIGISNGRITEIKKILKADDHINFKNKIILPSGIDIHVHFRDPGFTNKEDFSTGSTAAMFGGISCVFDMPNTKPYTITPKSLSEKISLASKKSYVDFGIYAGVTNENISSLDRLSKRCSGFKFYLGSSTGALTFDKSGLRHSLETISKFEKPVLFHAEDEELLEQNRSVEKNIIDHLHSRPSVCEETSIKDIYTASHGLNLNVHICHVSSIDGVEVLKSRPNNFTFGVTAHHTLLSIENIKGSQNFYKVNPPIRSSFDREALFNSLINGIADNLESDHAPHTREEKNSNFNEVPSGVPGVETLYPLFLYLAKKEIISFQILNSLMCKRPATLFNLSKGSIEVGNDADLIVVDLKEETRIKSEDLHSKCEWTPYEDWKAIFPSDVFIRGTRVIEDREIRAKKGFGNFIGE